MALENTKTVAGCSQQVKHQQIVGASEIVMTCGIKCKLTMQTAGSVVLVSDCLKSVRPLALSAQKEVEGVFSISIFYPS